MYAIRLAHVTHDRVTDAVNGATYWRHSEMTYSNPRLAVLLAGQIERQGGAAFEYGDAWTEVIDARTGERYMEPLPPVETQLWPANPINPEDIPF